MQHLSHPIKTSACRVVSSCCLIVIRLTDQTYPIAVYMYLETVLGYILIRL